MCHKCQSRWVPAFLCSSDEVREEPFCSGMQILYSARVKSQPRFMTWRHWLCCVTSRCFIGSVQTCFLRDVTLALLERVACWRRRKGGTAKQRTKEAGTRAGMLTHTTCLNTHTDTYTCVHTNTKKHEDISVHCLYWTHLQTFSQRHNYLIPQH